MKKESTNTPTAHMIIPEMVCEEATRYFDFTCNVKRYGFMVNGEICYIKVTTYKTYYEVQDSLHIYSDSFALQFFS